MRRSVKKNRVYEEYRTSSCGKHFPLRMKIIRVMPSETFDAYNPSETYSD